MKYQAFFINFIKNGQVSWLKGGFSNIGLSTMLQYNVKLYLLNLPVVVYGLDYAASLAIIHDFRGTKHIFQGTIRQLIWTNTPLLGSITCFLGSITTFTFYDNPFFCRPKLVFIIRRFCYFDFQIGFGRLLVFFSHCNIKFSLVFICTTGTYYTKE